MKAAATAVKSDYAGNCPATDLGRAHSLPVARAVRRRLEGRVRCPKLMLVINLVSIVGTELCRDRQVQA